MSDGHVEDADVAMSVRAKVIAAALIAVLLVGAAAVLMRLESPVITAVQAPPAGHYPLRCGLCHAIYDRAGTEAAP